LIQLLALKHNDVVSIIVMTTDLKLVTLFGKNASEFATPTAVPLCVLGVPATVSIDEAETATPELIPELPLTNGLKKT
tara:strand:+ start:55 stop:288 length:234 start_codon:yes stop_codon:yes gene_type:complete